MAGFLFRLETVDGEPAHPPNTECDARWLPADEERWSAYWFGDGPEEELAFYCAECAEREFGES